MPITPEKMQALADRFLQLGILEKDCTEQFIQGSGKGGQKINKSSSCVRLKHEPTGLEVKCQKSREREMNRFFARRLLADLYEERILGVKTKKTLQQEKATKQKARRSRKSAQKYRASEEPI